MPSSPTRSDSAAITCRAVRKRFGSVAALDGLDVASLLGRWWATWARTGPASDFGPVTILPSPTTCCAWTTTKAEQLAGAEADEAGDDHECSEPRCDRIREPEHELGVDHRPLVGVLGAATADAARIATDQVVVNGGVEDCSEQPVALRRLVTAGVDRDLEYRSRTTEGVISASAYCPIVGSMFRRNRLR